MGFPYTEKIGPDARIRVSVGGDDRYLGTLADWFADNADGVSPAEQVDIVRTLETGQPYKVAGDAGATWTLELFQP